MSDSERMTRLMTIPEVARELGYKSRQPVYDLIYAHELLGVNPSPGKKRGLRVTRASFETYLERIEAQATAARTGKGAA